MQCASHPERPGRECGDAVSKKGCARRETRQDASMAGAHGAERRHAGRPEGDLRDRIGASVVLSFLVVRVFVFLLQN